MKVFNYSDGDEEENYLISLFTNANNLATGSQELAAGIRDWSSLYHLSPMRANLIRPFATALAGKSVLEIGSGCGAITRFLGESGCNVLALEGSERRSRITALRCTDLPGVQVVNKSFDEFHTDEKFEVITLVGVLEYSNLFVNGTSAPFEMLRRIKEMLLPGGRLLIAIENKIGLKYWAGAPEDHIGKPYFGIEGRYDHSTVVTFGKTELKEMLLSAGYTNTEFLYPFPDYKLPDTILTEKAFEVEGFNPLSLLHEKYIHEKDRSYDLHFSSSLVANSLYQNKLLQDLSNSFLVVASPTDIAAMVEPSQIAFTYTSFRQKPYCKENIFVHSGPGNITVMRNKLYPDLRSEGAPIYHRLENEPFFFGRLLAMEATDLVSREGWTVEELAPWARQYYDILKGHALATDTTPSAPGDMVIPGAYLDLTPFNIIIDKEGEPTIFDQEWYCKEDIPLYFILFRGIVYTLDKISFYALPAEGTPENLIALVSKLINLIFPFSPLHIENCRELEVKYFSWVTLLPGKAFPHGNFKVRQNTGTSVIDQLRKEQESKTEKIEQLEKYIQWYRETYEERSFSGVIRDRLGKVIRKKHN